MSTAITDQQKQQYQDEGYFILERALSDDQLEDVDSIGINHRNKRYFSANVFRDRPELLKFLKSDLMVAVCKAVFGDTAYLFWEQYVIKCSDKDTTFSWHQDSGYVHPYHQPYLSCWIPLDDVNEENGTVSILPYSRVGIKSWVKHIVDPHNNDKVGYFGSDKGIPVIVPAGSMVCFSSVLFHSSGANLTNKLRRVYLAQYSGEKIMREDNSRLWGNAEPVVVDGRKAE
jgi:ectoine hydroxylase-related dioxygenase (phytanoyl-CoA dioxygenase family)